MSCEFAELVFGEVSGESSWRVMKKLDCGTLLRS